MDFLDITMTKDKQTLTGKYYKKYPNFPNDFCEVFNYEYVDTSSKSFQRIFGNVTENNATITTIKTKNSIDFKVESFILLQNNKFYQILEVGEDYQSVNREVYRYVNKVSGIEKTLRLTEIDNPYQIK